MQLEWANTWTFCLKDIGNYLSVSTMLGKKYVVDKYHHHQLGMETVFVVSREKMSTTYYNNNKKFLTFVVIVPSPSLSKRRNASLNSATCSSERSCLGILGPEGKCRSSRWEYNIN